MTKQLKTVSNTLLLKKKFKKKWRFWRQFKFFFLKNKKKNFFTKLKWFFNQKRIVWHQLSSIYGKKIKNLAYSNNQSKVIFNVRFFNLLIFLESRLNILLLRIGFGFKLLEVNNLIKSNNIVINNQHKQCNYLVKVGDIIKCIFPKFLKQKRFKRLKWRRFKWIKWRKLKKESFKNNLIKFFWLSKKNLIINYVEINFKIFSAIILRKPLMGEILINNNNKMLSLNLLKKIYFIY